MSIQTISTEKFDIEAIKKALNPATAKVVIVFYPASMGVVNPVGEIKKAFPNALCAGMSSMGCYNEKAALHNGVTALALTGDEVDQCWGVMGNGFLKDAALASKQLVDSLKTELNGQVLDMKEYLGLVFVNGLCYQESLTAALANEKTLRAQFIGGAAADNMRFTETFVSLNDKTDKDSSVILMLKMKVPFCITHEVHFAATGNTYIVTKSNQTKRILKQLDGQRAGEVFATAAHIPFPRLKDRLQAGTNFTLGIAGVTPSGRKALFLRTPRDLEKDGSLTLFCGIPEGTRCYLLKSTGEVVGSVLRATKTALTHLGKLSGALHFNCLLREIEVREAKDEGPFQKALSTIPCICGNTLGEIAFGVFHNHSFVSVWFGQKAP